MDNDELFCSRMQFFETTFVMTQSVHYEIVYNVKMACLRDSTLKWLYFHYDSPNVTVILIHYILPVLKQLS